MSLPLLTFEQALAQRCPLILDGGLATFLEGRGHKLNDPLWSARLIQDAPEEIAAAHLAYLQAGADIILTAGYQASFPGLRAAGFTYGEARALMLQAVEIAESVRNLFLSSRARAFLPMVAASIGPYGAYLADGSEYRGNYRLPRRVLREFHHERFALLAESGADFLAAETVPSFLEAQVLGEMADEIGAATWISFSCRDDEKISDGTPIRECARLVEAHPRLTALGINCTAPREISGILEELRNVGFAKPIIVYPNAGNAYNPETKAWEPNRAKLDWGRMAGEWQRRGAAVIGGCCCVGPPEITAIKDEVRRRR
ncbi:MAG: homocysteine S-methyltransferase [Bacteroidota bacterium]